MTETAMTKLLEGSTLATAIQHMDDCVNAGGDVIAYEIVMKSGRSITFSWNNKSEHSSLIQEGAEWVNTGNGKIVWGITTVDGQYFYINDEDISYVWFKRS